jgi:hypothetical protein
MKEKCTVLKVPKKCALVVLVRAGRRWGSEEGKGSGLVEYAPHKTYLALTISTIHFLTVIFNCTLIC